MYPRRSAYCSFQQFSAGQRERRVIYPRVIESTAATEAYARQKVPRLFRRSAREWPRNFLSPPPPLVSFAAATWLVQALIICPLFCTRHRAVAIQAVLAPLIASTVAVERRIFYLFSFSFEMFTRASRSLLFR